MWYQALCIHTQVSVVLMRLEEFIGSVEQEFERQEYFHVGSLLQKALVHDFSVLQLVYTNCVGPGTIANGVQRVQHLSDRIIFICYSEIVKKK